MLASGGFCFFCVHHANLIEGIEVCRQIRQASFVPIVIISAKSSDLDKLVSLGVGADDYLTKPFSLVELVARAKSHIRRYVAFGSRPAAGAGARMTCGPLIVDPASFTASVSGETCRLRQKSSACSNTSTSAHTHRKCFPRSSYLQHFGVPRIMWTITLWQ